MLVNIPYMDAMRNILHLKMDGWNTSWFPFGAKGLFSGAFAVSFREGQLSFFLHPVFLENPEKWTKKYTDSLR